MSKNEYVNELYEKYEEEFIRSKNYQNMAEKLFEKYEEMKKKFTVEQLKDVDEFEKYLSALLEMEVKEAFKQGFESGRKMNSN